jgi:glucans biosynthesis protein
MNNKISRRSFMKTASLLGFGGAFLNVAGAVTNVPSGGLRFGPAEAFSFDALIERASAMAKMPYVSPPRPMPEVVQQIDYDAWGNIRYRPDSALFANGPAQYPATFFHVGQFFQKSVKMHVLERGQAREILYSPDYFSMPKDSIAHQLPENTGFAGFRLQESRKRKDWRTQDWVAFLGASYFRAIGALNQYGLSARGAIIDSAEPTPEEFPDFTEFFIEGGRKDSDPVSIYALLNSPSLTGAYHFTVRRTEGVIQEIDMALFVRSDIKRLGLAPLTSMYWFSESEKRKREDWRPEVHDSDGLAIWNGQGERLWRPLINQPFAVTSSFTDNTPKGFGLLQRDRNFEDYLDGVNYERRPSLWVEPLGDWGPGAIQLIELPTDDEIHDNVVAYWRPQEPARAGSSYRMRYRLHWLGDEPYPAKVARCVATRVGRGGQPGKPRPRGVFKFSVEFAGPALDPLWGDTVKAEPIVTASSGTVSGAFMQPVPGTRRWRAIFDLTPVGNEPVELRLYIRGNDNALTETWLYQFRAGLE